MLDTNLFVDGLRYEQAKQERERFHTLFAPFEFLSAIVVQELVAGTRSLTDPRALQRHIVEPFARRGRLVTSSFRAWQLPVELLAKLNRKEGRVVQAGHWPEHCPKPALASTGTKEDGPVAQHAALGAAALTTRGLVVRRAASAKPGVAELAAVEFVTFDHR